MKKEDSDTKQLKEFLSNSEQRQNQRELEQLRRVYTLFSFSLEGKVLNIQLGKNHSFNPRLEHGHLEHESIFLLDKAHMEKTLSTDLMKLYPDLYISVYANKDECEASVWVNRPRDGESDDAEAIGELNIIDKDLHKTLKQWQTEADQAKRNKWFFCSGHQVAEPEFNFGYFYFAGKYCKKWATEHPENVKRAAMETYE